MSDVVEFPRRPLPALSEDARQKIVDEESLKILTATRLRAESAATGELRNKIYLQALARIAMHVVGEPSNVPARRMMADRVKTVVEIAADAGVAKA
jgi:hypothetical protein